MSSHDCLIIERNNEWLITVAEQTERLALTVPPLEIATCVNLMIKLAGVKTPNCVLAPSATSCFFASLPCGEDIDVRDRNALTYELESRIPLDAEAMAADFVTTPPIPKRSNAQPATTSAQDDSKPMDIPVVSAVAVAIEPWKAIADALEDSGVPVRCIVPAALMASRPLANEFGSDKTAELMLIDDGMCDALTMFNETVIGWKHLPLQASSLRRHRLLDVPQVERVHVVGADENQISMIRETFGPDIVEESNRDLESLWQEGGQLAVAKHSARWFDLRRDQLGPSDPLRPVLPHLRLVTAAAIACLLAVAIGGWWRGKRIEAEIERLNQQQRAAFQELFPDARVPAALLRRVRSEHAKVRGSRVGSTDIDAPQSATEVLEQLLAALPDTVRFRITSVKILNGRVDIDLQVRTTVDAGALAGALEENGFEVEPPVTTRKDARTFDSTLEARWVGRRENQSSNESAKESRLPHATYFIRFAPPTEAIE